MASFCTFVQFIRFSICSEALVGSVVSSRNSFTVAVMNTQ